MQAERPLPIRAADDNLLPNSSPFLVLSTNRADYTRRTPESRTLPIRSDVSNLSASYQNIPFDGISTNQADYQKKVISDKTALTRPASSSNLLGAGKFDGTSTQRADFDKKPLVRWVGNINKKIGRLEKKFKKQKNLLKIQIKSEKILENEKKIQEFRKNLEKNFRCEKFFFYLIIFFFNFFDWKNLKKKFFFGISWKIVLSQFLKF